MIVAVLLALSSLPGCSSSEIPFQAPPPVEAARAAGAAGAAGAPAGPPFRLKPAGPGEVITGIAATPAGPERLIYVEAAGRFRELDQAAPIGDISGRLVSGGELGLLGLAIHPRWPTDRRIFVNYTFREGRQIKSKIASFLLAEGPGGAVDTASEVEILRYDQPWPNHNSGALAFGPDEMLYVAVGDGGSGGDPRGTGQDRRDLLGSILRIDVSGPVSGSAAGGAGNYRVPADNPFTNQENIRPEIWAYGVRNPWGMHFDGATLWFADVGQDTWEEINRGVKGGNYGWNIMEATHCFEAETCDSAGLVAPVAEYSHREGQSVTGGLVYRGPSIPALDGRYVYADFASGRFWTLDPAGGKPVSLGTFELNPSAFGQDRQRRLYVADIGKGLFAVIP